jgi:flagellar hook-basal body complex protein FliE
MNEVTFQKGLDALIGPDTAQKQKQDQNSVSFGNMLARSLEEVNRLQITADEAIEDLEAGKQKNIHETMIAMEKADVAFQLLMQVRNKIISAYETIMRMQT